MARCCWKSLKTFVKSIMVNLAWKIRVLLLSFIQSGIEFDFIEDWHGASSIMARSTSTTAMNRSVKLIGVQEREPSDTHSTSAGAGVDADQLLEAASPELSPEPVMLKSKPVDVDTPCSLMTGGLRRQRKQVDREAQRVRHR